jgi:ATP-dependent Clp protease ATP-binding subunit ClpC
MFERFTDRARRVLVLAQEESRTLGHSVIAPEHLLLGLLAEHDGVAAKALMSAGADLERARQVTGTLLSPSRDGQSGSPPFAPESKKALEKSLRAALVLEHGYIGTEHILLGVLDLGPSSPTELMEALELDPEDLRIRVTELVEVSGPPSEVGTAGNVKERVQERVRRLQGGTGHQPHESRQLRIHVLEGLLRGIELYGEVVETVLHCTDRAEARRALTSPPFNFSDVQATYVLDMSVAATTDEHRARLQVELDQLRVDENG